MPSRRTAQSNRSKKETETPKEIEEHEEHEENEEHEEHEEHEEPEINDIQIQNNNTTEIDQIEEEQELVNRKWNGPKEFINVVLLLSIGEKELPHEQITEIIDRLRENKTDVLVHFLSGGNKETVYPDKNIKQVCRGHSINYVSRPWYVEHDGTNEASVLKRMEEVFSISASKTNYWISESRSS